MQRRRAGAREDASGALVAGQAEGTCPRPYTDSSPWNTPIGPDPNYVYSYVSADNSMLNRLEPGTIDVPIPSNAETSAGNDSELILVDPVTGDEWGFWQLGRSDAGRWTAVNAYHYNIRWSGVPPREEDGRPFGSRGAGVPQLVGLVRPCEVERGRIEHALRFAYDHPSEEHVYPASKSDGTGDDSALPEGSRLQLDPSIPEREIREWGCRGPCLTAARALQKYGMYVLDNSGRPKIAFEDERTADWNGRIDAETVSPIPLSAFRVVEPVEASRQTREQPKRSVPCRDSRVR